MPQSDHVILLSTCAMDQAGSMRRYAELVETSLRAAASGMRVSRIDLAPSAAWLSRFPRILRSRLHHLIITLNVLRRRRRWTGALLHVLDGSHGYILSLLPSKKVLVTCHDLIPLQQCLGHLGPKPSLPAQRTIRKSAQSLTKAQQVIAGSRFTASALREFLNIPEAKITVQLYPVSAFWQYHSPSARNDQILHLGHNGFYKNRLAVLRIFERMHTAWPGKLIMAGAPPTAEMRAQVESSGLADRVEFSTEPSDETIRELYATSKVFLFPSALEGFGWPPLEAAACGCPSVVSDVGGIRDALSSKGALFFSPDDEAGMAVACIQLLHAPEQREALVTEARKQLEHLTLDAFGAALIAIYTGGDGCAS